MQSIDTVGCVCGHCKKKTDPEYARYCGQCVQIAYCGEGCQNSHFKEHSASCKQISAQQLSELCGFAGYADNELISAEDIAAPRGGGGGRGGGMGGGGGAGGGSRGRSFSPARSTSPRLSPPPRPISPTRTSPVSPTRFSPSGTRPVSPTRVSPTRVSPTRFSPTRYPSRYPSRYGPGFYPYWDPYRYYLPGIVPPFWLALGPLWQPYWSLWYPYPSRPLFDVIGLPVLPPWDWVDDPIAISAQLAILQAAYSFPGAYIAPDPMNRRFIWMRRR